MRRGAEISPCGQYRWALFRAWDDTLPAVCFIGLNPSTADGETDDPTIRRCVGFAQAWGCGSLIMLNLFAYRATEPRDMMAATDPVGPENDDWLQWMPRSAALTVAAWGAGGAYRGRGDAVRAMVPDLCVLRLTKEGHPGHPLYLPKTLPLLRW